MRPQAAVGGMRDFSPQRLGLVHGYRELVVDGHREPDGRLVVSDTVGSTLVDLVGSTALDFLLLSPRFEAVLAESGATGWETADICVQDAVERRFPEIGQYKELRVTGVAGPLRMASSGEPPTQESIWNQDGLEIDELSWDGSDLFRAGEHEVFVSSPDLAARLRAAELSNLSLESLDEVLSGWRRVLPRRERNRRQLP